MAGSPCRSIGDNSRILVKRLNKSLAVPDSGWTVIEDSIYPVCLEFKHGEVVYQITMNPRFGSCFMACCDRVRLLVNKTLIPLPARQANKLGKHARMFVIRHARKLSDSFPIPEDERDDD